MARTRSRSSMLRAVVKPVLGQFQRPGNTCRCAPHNGRCWLQKVRVDVFGCLSRSVEQNQGGAADHYELCSIISISRRQLLGQRIERSPDVDSG
jgi:hypothetical protein